MKADQIIIVGGTRNGQRETSEPLPANAAIIRFNAMRAQGYTLLTMTDAESGDDYNVSGSLSPSTNSDQ